jgi:serine/threonine protein kinase
MNIAVTDSLPDGYTFVDVIGNGINGVVVSAVDSVTGKQVALKRFRRGLGKFAPGLQEISNVIGLDHPRIVTCRDCGYDGLGNIYVTYDLIEGGDLRTWINELDGTPLPAEAIKACAGQMLDALVFLRTQNLIHGDLKPENILIESRSPPRFRLADLGGALRCKGDAIRLREPTGSPAYLAPERFYDRFSFNADLYSLGVILFELSTGSRPFSGSVSELARAHIVAQADFSKIPDDGLRSFIEALLEKDPQIRVRSAAEALRIWRIYLDSGKFSPIPEIGPRPHPPPALEPTWKNRTYTVCQRFSTGGHPLQVGFLRSHAEPLVALGFKSHVEIWDARRGSLLSVFLPGKGGDLRIPPGNVLYFPDSRSIRRWSPGMRRAEPVLDLPGGVQQIALDRSGEGCAYLDSNSLTVRDRCGRVSHHRLEKRDSTAKVTFLRGGEVALLEGRLPTTVTILDTERRVCHRFPLPGAAIQISPFCDPAGVLVNWENQQSVSYFSLDVDGFKAHTFGQPAIPLHPIPGGCLYREQDSTLIAVSEEGRRFYLGKAPEADLHGLSHCQEYLLHLFKRKDGSSLIEIRHDSTERDP